jgi:hypothetical protein
MVRPSPLHVHKPGHLIQVFSDSGCPPAASELPALRMLAAITSGLGAAPAPSAFYVRLSEIQQGVQTNKGQKLATVCLWVFVSIVAIRARVSPSHGHDL